MPEERKTQSAEKYIVRFPEGMRERIAEAAKTNNRSMNAEIVARLEASFSAPTAPDVSFLMSKLNYDLADAELDKQLLILKVQELGVMVKTFADTLQICSLEPSTLKLVSEWAQDARAMVEEAAGKAAMPVDAALEKLRRSADDLAARTEQLQRARASAQELPLSEEGGIQLRRVILVGNLGRNSNSVLSDYLTTIKAPKSVQHGPKPARPRKPPKKL